MFLLRMEMMKSYGTNSDLEFQEVYMKRPNLPLTITGINLKENLLIAITTAMTALSADADLTLTASQQPIRSYLGKVKSKILVIW